jgi:hypothetical protein
MLIQFCVFQDLKSAKQGSYFVEFYCRQQTNSLLIFPVDEISVGMEIFVGARQQWGGGKNRSSKEMRGLRP